MLPLKTLPWKPLGGWVFWTQTALSPCLCQSLAQSCSTACDPMDCRLPGSSVHRIFQARILEWVASFLLQRIFPTQGLTHVSCVSCTAGFFTCWAIREALLLAWGPANKYCTLLYHNLLVPVGWLCYKAGKWTQIWFSNNFSKNNESFTIS